MHQTALTRRIIAQQKRERQRLESRTAIRERFRNGTELDKRVLAHVENGWGVDDIKVRYGFLNERVIRALVIGVCDEHE